MSKMSMKKYQCIILLFGLIFLVYASNVIALENVFEVNLIFNRLNNSVKIDSVKVMQWYVNVESSQSGQNIANKYEVRLASATGTSLYSTYVEPSYILLSDPPEQLDVTLLQLYFPYDQGAKLLKIFYQGQQKLSLNFGSLICNYNKVCDNSETYLSCPNDCQWYAKDTICSSEPNDYYCDWDCLFDADSTGECYKANCNPGRGLSGNICQRYLCSNNKKDSQEEGIDCGGVCPDNCPVNFCGDGICAEYESISTCPIDCSAPISILKNTGQTSLSGYLSMKVQKLVNYTWQDYQVILNEYTSKIKIARTIYPGQQLNLKAIWNSKNYLAKEAGQYRVFTALLDAEGKAMLAGVWEFSVVSPATPSPSILPSPTATPTPTST